MNKPIQHKMEYKGKKYVTEIGSFCCNGCAFIGKPCRDIVGCNKCLQSRNEDYTSRIWVEDKSEDKPKKDDHAWLIEYYDDIEEDWFIWTASKTRKVARDCAKSMVSKTRVRKFVPEK